MEKSVQSFFFFALDLWLLLLPIVGHEADQGHKVGGGILLIKLLLHIRRNIRGQDLKKGLKIIDLLTLVQFLILNIFDGTPLL